jgi:hypothetical protein
MLNEMLPQDAVLNLYVSYSVIEIHSGESKTASIAMSDSEAQPNCLPDSLPTLTNNSMGGPE